MSLWRRFRAKPGFPVAMKNHCFHSKSHRPPRIHITHSLLSCQQVLLSEICCQLFQQYERRNEPTNWNGFDQLRMTPFTSLEQLSPHYQTQSQGQIRVHPGCSAIQQLDVVHIPQSRKPSRHIALQMLPLHFWCLVEGHAPNFTILHVTGSFDLIGIMRQRRVRVKSVIGELVACPRILYGEFYNALRRTGRPKLRYKNVNKRNMASFHISPQSWETLADDCSRWRASRNEGYSFSITIYAKNGEEQRSSSSSTGWDIVVATNRLELYSVKGQYFRKQEMMQS